MGITGALFLMGNSATLNTGKHNTNWHVFCAVNTFAWSIFSSWYHTYICWILYKNTKAVNYRMTILKIIMSLAMLVQMYIDVVHAG